MLNQRHSSGAYQTNQQMNQLIKCMYFILIRKSLRNKKKYSTDLQKVMAFYSNDFKRISELICIWPFHVTLMKVDVN